jgi:RNA polymerase sigma-70 factor (ECF subfamily)
VGEPQTDSDNELIASSLRGDTQAFGVLIHRYRKMVIGVAYRVCGNIELAEDMAQETFIRVWDKLSSFRPEGNFRGWICRIAANLTIDTLRRQKPTVDIEKVVAGSTDDGPERVALKRERAAAVRAAILKLPPQTRTTLVLREYQGFSYQEIADALDVPLGTVKSRLSDARRRLKIELVGILEG